MLKSYKIFFIFSIFFYSHLTLAWNGTGHRLVAAIAYQRLNPYVKQRIDSLTKINFSSDSGFNRFLKASVWADTLRYHDVSTFNAWHYFSKPYVINHVRFKLLAKENVAWAIGQSINVLASRKSNRYEKMVFLNFLVHFVGDIHQPLHCINLFSKKFPKGDKGGNLFTIKTRYADNLHYYWDQGVGLFHVKHQHYPLRYRAVRRLAARITQEYPEPSFKGRIYNSDPFTWAKESYHLAKSFAYNIAFNGRPSIAYIKKGQEISEKRVALAGYRLANILNSIH